MNSNDDQSSLPATQISLRHSRCGGKLRTARCVSFALVVASALFLSAPRFAAQTPSEPPPAAQSQQQSTPAPAQQPPQQAVPPARTIQLDDFTKISSVSDPQISPDGKSIAFVLSRINLEQDRARSEERRVGKECR